MLTLPKKPKIVEKSNNRAVVEISELYPGYGPTIGNTLRRALYSSIEGAAITSGGLPRILYNRGSIGGRYRNMFKFKRN